MKTFIFQLRSMTLSWFLFLEKYCKLTFDLFACLHNNNLYMLVFINIFLCYFFSVHLMSLKVSDTTSVKHLRMKLRHYLDTYLRLNQLHLSAVMLHPCLKSNTNIMTDAEKDEAMDCIRKIYDVLIPTSQQCLYFYHL